MPVARYEVEIDGMAECAWYEALDGFCDANLYQTWAYGVVRRGRGSLSHIVLRRDGDIVAMAQLRVLKAPLLKVGIAYLRWGPVCERKGHAFDPDVMHAFAVALRAEYTDARGLYLQVAPNAFDDSMRAEAAQAAFSAAGYRPETVGDPYRTLVVDLAPEVAELRQQLDQKWRNQLNGAERNDLVVEESESMEAYRGFCDLYEAMWSRKRFTRIVSVEEYGSIQAALPPQHRMRILTCLVDGAPVAGLVWSMMGDTGLLIFAATTERGMAVKGANLLQWRLVQTLKERGARYYDLGGIDPDGNPGVYRFKRGLSGRDRSYIPGFAASPGGIGEMAVLGAMRLRKRLTRWA